MGTSKSSGSSRQSRLARLLGPIVALATIISMILAPAPVARAATSLTVTPITWNVIGLDSNNVYVGPNNFPIGARVCNLGGSATSVTGINFVWDDGAGVFTSSAGANTYFNLRDGTLSSLYSSTAPLSLAAKACSDAYFEVSVNRVSHPYDHTRNYHITATDAGGTASTPTPRQLYVEHLISQSRNSVTGMGLAPDVSGSPGSYAPIAAGGTMTLIVGNTY